MSQPRRRFVVPTLEQGLIADLVAQYKNTVRNAMGIASADAVHVESYFDPMTITHVEPQAASTTDTTVISKLSSEFNTLTLEVDREAAVATMTSTATFSVFVSLESTVKVGGMVFFILMSSTVFSQLLAYSGASAGMLQWATTFKVSPLVILLIIQQAIMPALYRVAIGAPL